MRPNRDLSPRTPRALTAAFAALVLLACSTSSPTAASRCTPGQASACVCTDGRTGAQSCGNDGTYAACVCGASPGSADASIDASPDATVSADGGPADGSRDATPDAGADGAAGDDGSAGEAQAGEAGAFTCTVCPAGYVLCGGPVCVPSSVASTPSFGCGVPPCTPCATPPHGQPACTGGACSLGVCDVGWADCDGDPSDGCEADLSLPRTCGGCGIQCGAGSVCASAGCAPSCPAGTISCSGSCRDPMTNPHSCGNCTYDCGPSGTCSGGNCGSPGCSGNDVNGCGASCTVCSVSPVVLETSAPLTRPFCNAGKCDFVCAPGWNCTLAGSGATPATLSPSVAIVPYLNSPQGIAVDSANVYYSETGVWQAPKAGGTPQKLSDDSPTLIALDDAYVYWNDGTSIRRVAKGGGATSTLATPAQSPVGGVAVDDTSVYWVSGGGFYQAPKVGGSPTLLGSLPDAGTVVGYQIPPSGPVVAANQVAFSQNGSLWSVSTAGGTVSLSPASTNGGHAFTFYGPIAASPNGVAVEFSGNTSAGNSYATFGNGIPGPLGFPIAPTPGPSGPFVEDSCAIYFVFSSGVGRLFNGVTMYAEEVVAGVNQPNQLALDDSFVYWTDRDSVRRAPR